MSRRVVLFAVLALVACEETRTTSLTSTPTPDSGIGVIDAGNSISCGSLVETDCTAEPACSPLSCADCSGEESFFACFGALGNGAPIGCPPINCPVCAGLDEVSCGQNEPQCRGSYCSDCDGNAYFAACNKEGFITPCPDLLCPEDRCLFHDEASCAADAECHRVFSEQSAACDCDSPGCCQFFERCGRGPANCDDSNLGCRAREPLCEGPFVVSYEGTCFEGCVLAEDCDAP